eukprot:TRINITY_DN58691_c0_g1_i1.p1 TRINITY_DN58691_c0_g1~~TRINITY_DN58691_c0_g1_i1.p1  ORF type:complete len:591 (-),score=86.12 TRINITY_DN58691_c0_g1_i1:155-1927(-)
MAYAGKGASAKAGASVMLALKQRLLAVIDEHETALTREINDLRAELFFARREKQEVEQLERQQESGRDKLAKENEELKQRLQKLRESTFDELTREIAKNEQLESELKALKVQYTALQQGVDQQSPVPHAAAPLTHAEAAWQFKTSAGEWTDMPAKASGELFQHFEKHTSAGSGRIPKLTMKSGVEEYEFDLEQMSQRNVRTEQERAIRFHVSVPSHWTKCVDLQSIFTGGRGRSIVISGFTKKRSRFNGRYTQCTKYREPAGDNFEWSTVWWRDDGLFYIFRDRGHWILSSVDADYPGFARLDESRWDAMCASNGFGPCSDHWSVESRRRGWVVASGINVEDVEETALPGLMDIADEIWDPEILEELREFMFASVSHETGHFDASGCDDCKVPLKFRLIRALRIENWRLLAKYGSHKEQMKQDLGKHGIHVDSSTLMSQIPEELADSLGRLDSGVSESFLWHGTSRETAVKIAHEGFDFRLSEPGYYGRGTYFASQACKSHQYTENSPSRCVILSRVALGDVAPAVRVINECTRPPLHPGTLRCCDTVYAKPGPMPGHRQGQQTQHEFIIFEKFQAYPELLIEYVVENQS